MLKQLLVDLPPGSVSFGKVEKALDQARQMKQRIEENEKAWKEREASADVLAGPGTVSRVYALRERVWAPLFDTYVHDPVDIARKEKEGIPSLSAPAQIGDGGVRFFDLPPFDATIPHTDTWRTNLSNPGTLGRADRFFGQDASMEVFSADLILTAENMNLALAMSLNTAAIELRVGEKSVGSFSLHDALEIVRASRHGDDTEHVIRARFHVPLTGHTAAEIEMVRSAVENTARFEKHDPAAKHRYFKHLDEAVVADAEDHARALIQHEGGADALAHLGFVHEKKVITVPVRQCWKAILWPSAAFIEGWNAMPGYKSLRLVLNTVVTRDIA